MTKIDTLTNAPEIMRMRLVEFLVFIALISEIDDVKNFELQFKIDKVLTKLFATIQA